MDLPSDTSTMRGPVLQTLIALAVILLAFRVADVAPLRAEPRVIPEAAYTAPLRLVDEALARQDGTAASRAWQDAYAASVGSTSWEGLVAAGDAARRIGEAIGSRGPAEAKARTAYLAAFFRARQQGAVVGMLSAADGFAALGDSEVSERCRSEAVELGARETARTAPEIASRSAAR